jgi:hypothetical protein
MEWACPQYLQPPYFYNLATVYIAVERIVERNDPAVWKAVIEDAEDKRVSWKHRSNKGNLCGERLGNKHNKYKDQLGESVDSVLGLLIYQRCMLGNHDLVLKEMNPALVEHAFGRIKIILGHTVPKLSRTISPPSIPTSRGKCENAW